MLSFLGKARMEKDLIDIKIAELRSGKKFRPVTDFLIEVRHVAD